jgi:hypothetical protein
MPLPGKNGMRKDEIFANFVRGIDYHRKDDILITT